jgi:hypothetical protein
MAGEEALRGGDHLRPLCDRWPEATSARPLNGRGQAESSKS